MYIKGNLVVQVDDVKLNFQNQNISAFGVSGLSWSNLDPVQHFGKLVPVLIEIQKPKPYTLRVLAVILSESTPDSITMGLKFNLNQLQKKEFTAFIIQYGMNPPEYARKYPRIPSDAQIQTFPMRALVTVKQSKKPKPDFDPKIPMIFDIENLSPTGILMCTENQNAIYIEASDLVDITLEPRGWFTIAVHITCVVCRVTDELNPLNANILRRIGLKFETISPADKEAFIALLKEILQEVKTKKDETE